MDEHEWLAEQFETNRTLLQAVAYETISLECSPYTRITIPSHAVVVEELSDPVVQQTALLVRLPIDFHQTVSLESEAMGVDLSNEPFSEGSEAEEFGEVHHRCCGDA